MIVLVTTLAQAQLLRYNVLKEKVVQILLIHLQIVLQELPLLQVKQHVHHVPLVRILVQLLVIVSHVSLELPLLLLVLLPLIHVYDVLPASTLVQVLHLV
jgi:hypothetical protein